MPIRILLIESDMSLAENLTRLMARKGHDVTTVTDAKGAGEALENGVYDLVIFGEELAAQGNGRLLQEAKTRHPQVRVILLASSGAAEGPSFEPPFEVFAFLQKPFRWDDLMEKIQEASSLSPP